MANIVKIKEAHPKLSENTITNYVKNYNRLITDGGDIKELLMAKPLATRHQYLWSIKTVMPHQSIKDKDLLEWVDEQINTGKKELKQYYQEQAKSKKESENWITLKELQKYNKKLRQVALTTKKTQDMRNWILTSLYVLDPVNHPPMRVDYNMEIVNGLTELDKSKNYLVKINKSKKEFVFNDYKTNKAHGEIRIPLSRKMNAAMNIYLSTLGSDHKFLFQDKLGKQITKNALQKQITRAFNGTGKTLGVSMLRHIVISENVDTGDKLKDKNEMAEKMGHSTSTQEIYKKFDK